MKNGTEAIGQLPELLKQFNQLHNRLAIEADYVSEEWSGLQSAGGGRDDHAATLLARLRPHLAELSRFALTCEKQIDQLVADPFGRNAA